MKTKIKEEKTLIRCLLQARNNKEIQFKGVHGLNICFMIWSPHSLAASLSCPNAESFIQFTTVVKLPDQPDVLCCMLLTCSELERHN